MISLLIDPTLEFPNSEFFFSPDEAFPEYRFGHLSSEKNPVYHAVRQCLAQSRLDWEHFGTASWNPLGKFINPAENVFVLCNFANERRETESVRNYLARCTHGSVIRSVIDYILIATGENGSVNFGNAPTQYCHWNQVLQDTSANKVLEFYKNNHSSVEARDLRLFVNDSNHLGIVRGVERRNESQGVHVKLGRDSLLSELDRNHYNRYRVMNYNPKRTQAFHSAGNHEFVVNHHILDADVVFSIPKLKTHEKVGISCALKGYVGTVGHKDSLPHHRYGSPNIGGDEYPDDRWGVLRFASAFHEQVQHTQPESILGSTLRVANRVLKRLVYPMAPVIEGAWWGNDTAWRMVLDLVRIANYATKTGELLDYPCRRNIAFIDGIYGGEKEGPASPSAVHTGVLMFGDNLPAVDTMCSLLMGFDPDKMPLIHKACTLRKYPISTCRLDEEVVTYNNQTHDIQYFKDNLHYHFEPSSGWKGKLEFTR